MVVFLTNEKVGFSLDFVIEWGEGSNLLLVLVLQDCCNLPHIVVFVAWLDAKLLSDVNSGHDQSGTVSKTHTGIVFSQCCSLQTRMDMNCVGVSLDFFEWGEGINLLVQFSWC